MASSSIKTFSLIKIQPQFPNPQTPNNTIHQTLKPSNPIHIQKPLSLYSTLRPISQFHLCPGHFNLSPHYSQLPILHKPTSNVALLRKFSTFCTEFFLIFLIGSFLFMGFLGTRPAVAISGANSSYSEKMEEKRETQKEKYDDEEMYMKLAEGSPRNVEALKMVFHEKMRRGKTKEALEYVKRLINFQPDEVEWRLLEALCYEMTGELSEAKRLFKYILAERPLLLRALHGIIYSLLDKKVEAEEQFEIYRSLVPEEFPQKGFLDDVVLEAKNNFSATA